MSKNPLSRRRFIQLGTGAVAATTVAKNILQPHQLYAAPRRVAPSDMRTPISWVLREAE